MVGHTGEHRRQLQYLPCMGTEGTVTAFRYIITILQKYPPPSPILARTVRHASTNQNVAGVPHFDRDSTVYTDAVSYSQRRLSMLWH